MDFLDEFGRWIGGTAGGAVLIGMVRWVNASNRKYDQILTKLDSQHELIMEFKSGLEVERDERHKLDKRVVALEAR